MTMFRRVSDVLTANLHALLDRAENPEAMLAQVIREMEEGLAALAAADDIAQVVVTDSVGYAPSTASLGKGSKVRILPSGELLGCAIDARALLSLDESASHESALWSRSITWNSEFGSVAEL